MKDILKNRKGFTLVELLAVIVVLAIIILIALPAVLSSMEKARKNAFIVEATETVKIAQTAYSDAIMSGKQGNTFCVDYAYLLDKGFIDKKDSTNYAGSVLIEVVPGTQKVTYTLWFSNPNYSITGFANNAQAGVAYADIDAEHLDKTTAPQVAINNCGKITSGNTANCKKDGTGATGCTWLTNSN